MTEPALRLADLPLPRRVAIGELVAEIVETESMLADLYERFARRTPLQPLGEALATLAREKRARLTGLQSLARACAVEGTPGPLHASPDAAVERRADLFARGFQGERAVEVRCRELAMFLGEVGVPPVVAELAAEAARHQARLRELYLRYS